MTVDCVLPQDEDILFNVIVEYIDLILLPKYLCVLSHHKVRHQNRHMNVVSRYLYCYICYTTPDRADTIC